MRLSAAIVASGIAALVTASPPSSAAVYELNSHTPNGPALEVSPEEARLGLALALGVSRYHKLGVQGINDKKIKVLEQFGRLENRIGLSPEDVGRFMLSLDGIAVEDADGMREAVRLLLAVPTSDNVRRAATEQTVDDHEERAGHTRDRPADEEAC